MRDVFVFSNFRDLPAVEFQSKIESLHKEAGPSWLLILSEMQKSDSTQVALLYNAHALVCVCVVNLRARVCVYV